MSVIWGKPLRKTVHDLVSDYPALRSQINEMKNDVNALKYTGFNLVRFEQVAGFFNCAYSYQDIGEYIDIINNTPVFGVKTLNDDRYKYKFMLEEIIESETVADYRTAYEYTGYVFRYFDSSDSHNWAIVLQDDDIAVNVRLD